MSQPSPSHIRATAIRVATLRRLALSVLFTTSTTSATALSQLTATRPLVPSLREPSIKGNTPMLDRVELSLITHYALRHGGSSDTALKEYRVDVSQCQLLEEKAGEGKAAKAARLFFGPPAAPVQGKGLGPDQRGGALDSCGRIVLITYGEGGQDNCIQRTVIASTAEPSGTN